MEENKVKEDVYQNLSKEYSPRFGEIAVGMGFITEKQLKEALVEQIDDKLDNHPHRFIGYILFENGCITNEQFDSVLDTLHKAPV
jgi:hypothetical protein